MEIGQLPPGKLNAITDVTGVRVGHATLIDGEGRLVVGRGPVRTGVTVALPHDGAVGSEPVLAGTLTMTGRDGYTFHALPHDRLTEVMDRYGRVRRPAG